MAEETTENVETPEAEETHVDTTDWKAEAKKWEARSKANRKEADELKAKADKWDQHEQEGKSELERLTEELEAAKAERDQLKHADEVRRWAADIERTTHVPASVLRGSTKEEMQAHADQLLRAGFSNYGRVPDGGEPPAPVATKESILAIENEDERIKAIVEHIDLF